MRFFYSLSYPSVRFPVPNGSSQLVGIVHKICKVRSFCVRITIVELKTDIVCMMMMSIACKIRRGPEENLEFHVLSVCLFHLCHMTFDPFLRRTLFGSPQLLDSPMKVESMTQLL